MLAYCQAARGTLESEAPATGCGGCRVEAWASGVVRMLVPGADASEDENSGSG